MPLPRPAIKVASTYPALLQKTLPHIKVTNTAKYSQSIKRIYQTLPSQLSSYQPDIVIMHVGLADCWPREKFNGKSRLDVASFTDYYEKIIKLIQASDIPLIIVGISPTSKKMNRKHPNVLKQITLFNRVLKKDADQNKIFFIDMSTYIHSNAPNKYLLPDDQHFNKAGHILMSKLIRELLNNHHFFSESGS